MDILTRVNWVDVLVLIIVLRTSYVSFKDGLSHELFPLLGSMVMVVVSLGYYGRLGSFLNQNLLGMPIELANFLAFAALVIVSGIAFKLLKILVDFIVRVEWNPAVEGIGGGICGVLRSFVASSLILMILCMLPLPYMQRSVRDNSVTGKHILGIGPYIFEKAAQAIPALSAEGTAVSRNDVIRNLEADKAIKTNMPKKEPRKTQWEKVAEI